MIDIICLKRSVLRQVMKLSIIKKFDNFYQKGYLQSDDIKSKNC